MDIKCLELCYLKINALSNRIKITYHGSHNFESMNLIITVISEIMFFTKNVQHVCGKLVFYTPLSI